MEILIAGLVIALIAVNIFWGYITHKLINKLMSRTYWDYQNSKMIPKVTEQEQLNEKIEIKVPTNNQELDSLDEMIKKVMPFG